MKGGVDFKAYDGLEHIYGNYKTWENVVHQINEGEMPPEDEPQMSSADKDFFLKNLKSILDKLGTEDLGDPGPALLRRLTRREYNNTIRDIFGVDLGLGKEFPSEGGGGEGFDNNAEVLSFSPMMFEKYVAEARKLSQHLTFNYTLGFEVSKNEVSLRNTPQRLTYIRRIENEYKTKAYPKKFDIEKVMPSYMKAVRELNLSETHDEETIRTFALERKLNFFFLLRMKAYISSPAKKNEVINGFLKLWFELNTNSSSEEVDKACAAFVAGYKKSKYIRKTHKEEKPQPYDDLVRKIKRMFVLNPLEVAESIGGPEGFKLKNIHTEYKLLKKYYSGDRQKFLKIALAKVPKESQQQAWLKPEMYLSKTGLKNYKRYSDRLKNETVEKRKYLKVHIGKLLTDAFRRPVTAEEIDEVVDFFLEVNAEKEEQAAARAVIVRIFCSPEFIFRFEKKKESQNVYQIEDRELAVRLSYFLWSSKPDKELMTLAIENKLSDNKTLDKQVERMLKDPKARAMAKDFAAQWLRFKDILEDVEIDKKRFPQFNEELRNDMFEECVTTVSDLIKNDLSVLTVLNSDYVFVNENLAKIYGLQSVKGDHFRKVRVEDKERGGLLTSPAVMAMTSYPLRTSPVLRGDYITSVLLGTPAPPPPNDVGELPEDDVVGDNLTVKQRLEAHRKNPQCAGCHSRLDPFGFPLEIYDPIGRRRSQIAGKPIDSTGEMKDRKVTGPTELKSYLLSKEELFLTNMASKLLGYSLGRSLSFYDKFTISQAVKSCRENNYKFSAMVKTIVHSKAFKYHRGNKK